MSDSDEKDTTQSVATRHPYTNDILAGAILLSFVAMVVAVAYAIARGHISAELPVGNLVLAYIAVVLIAATWAFGDKAVQAYKELRK